MDKKESIIKVAADLIKSEIRIMKYDSEYYICQDDVDPTRSQKVWYNF